MKKFTLIVEKGETDLWFVTSPEIRGLLVSEPKLGDALAAVPQAIVDLTIAKYVEGIQP